MKLQQYVSYVIGVFLTFPIRVFHVFSSEDTDNKNKEVRYDSKIHANNKAQTYPSMKGVKRTCGQSQRSARLARKAKTNHQ